MVELERTREARGFRVGVRRIDSSDKNHEEKEIEGQ